MKVAQKLLKLCQHRYHNGFFAVKIRIENLACDKFVQSAGDTTQPGCSATFSTWIHYFNEIVLFRFGGMCNA